MLRTVCTCVRRAGRACRARCAAVGRGELRERIRCVTLVLRHSGFTGDNAANQPAGHDSRRTFGRKHPAGSVVLRVLPVPPDLTSGSRSRDQSSKQALHGGAQALPSRDRPGPQNRICAVALLASGPVDRPRRARCDGAVEQRPPACQARQVVHRRTGVAAGPAHGLGARPRSPSAGAGRRPGHGGLRPAGHLRAGLAMVAAVSESWGARPDGENGKVVWFTPAGHGTGPRAAGKAGGGGGEAGDADAGGYACASPDADSYADAVAGCRACCGGGVPYRREPVCRRLPGPRFRPGRSCPEGRGLRLRRESPRRRVRHRWEVRLPSGARRGPAVRHRQGHQHQHQHQHQHRWTTPRPCPSKHRPGPHHDTCRRYGPRRRQPSAPVTSPRTRRGARLPAEAGRPRLTGLRPGHGEPAVQRVAEARAVRQQAGAQQRPGPLVREPGALPTAAWAGSSGRHRPARSLRASETEWGRAFSPARDGREKEPAALSLLTVHRGRERGPALLISLGPEPRSTLAQLTPAHGGNPERPTLAVRRNGPERIRPGRLAGADAGPRRHRADDRPGRRPGSAEEAAEAEAAGRTAGGGRGHCRWSGGRWPQPVTGGSG